MRIPKHLLPLAIGFSIITGSVRADILIDFDITGSAIDSSVPYTTTSVLISDMSLGAGLTFSGATTGSSTGGVDHDNRLQAAFDSPSVPDTLTAAISGNHYLSFTIQANTGFALNLNNAVFTYNMARPGPAGASNAALFTSVDGFTFGDQVGSQALSTAGSPTYAAPAQTFTLGASGYEDIVDELEVRLYVWGGNGVFYTNNVQLDGAIAAVPEPSAAALLMGGAALLLTGGKRRRSKNMAARL